MAEYSSVSITFLIDYDIDFTSSISTSLSGGTPSIQLWTWKILRTLPFEVTKGTPTGTTGERTAINYKAAFDLDNPTGYITSIVSNTVTIISETLGENFIGVKGNAADGSLLRDIGFIATFDNYEVPFDYSIVSTMLSRSPHYVNTPFYFDTTTSATIALKIYNGDFESPPSEASETITKIRPTIDYAEFNTNLSNIVNARLDSKLELDLTNDFNLVNANDNEFKWVTYEASYTDAQEQVAPVVGYFGASAGYGYYLQGINPQFEQKHLTSVLTRNVAKDGVIIFPFVNDGSYTNYYVQSFPSNVIDDNEALTPTTLSRDYIKYIMVDVAEMGTDNRFLIKLENSETSDKVEIFYNVIDECVNTPKTIIFKNKFGFYDTVTMFAKSVDTMTVTKDKFINNYVSQGAYDTQRHQIKDINVFANDSFKVNSGFIRESENVLYKELLLSDTVYLWDSINKDIIPIRVKTSNLTYKNRLNDKKVQYDIEFDYAFNTINNV